MPTYRPELASTLIEQAEVLAAAGRPHDARPLAERSVTLSEELVGRDPPDPLDPPPAAHPGARPPGRAPAGHRPAGGCRARTPPRRRAPRGDGRGGTRRARRRRRDRLDCCPDWARSWPRRGDLTGARRTLEQAAEHQHVASIAATDLTRCADLAARDESLSTEDRDRAIRDYAGRARDRLRRAVEAGDDPASPFFLAWLLTSCPVAELRDPPEAVRIARGILARAPGSWVAWATLGAAQYRSDSPRDAVAALEHAAELNRGDLLYYGYFLAMAHHQLDDHDRAKDCFDRADRRLQGIPPDEEVRRIRAEAAGRLGLADASRASPDAGLGGKTRHALM